VYTLLLILHLISAIVLIFVVLLQAGRGGGLSGAFGTGMGTETLFGARTGDMLTRATAVMATIFIVTSLGLAYLSARTGSQVTEKIRKEEREKSQQQEMIEQIKKAMEAQQAQEAAKAATEKTAPTDVKPAPEAVAPTTPPAEEKPVESAPTTE